MFLTGIKVSVPTFSCQSCRLGSNKKRPETNFHCWRDNSLPDFFIWLLLCFVLCVATFNHPSIVQKLFFFKKAFKKPEPECSPFFSYPPFRPECSTLIFSSESSAFCHRMFLLFGSKPTFLRGCVKAFPTWELLLVALSIQGALFKIYPFGSKLCLETDVLVSSSLWKLFYFFFLFSLWITASYFSLKYQPLSVEMFLAFQCFYKTHAFKEEEKVNELVWQDQNQFHFTSCCLVFLLCLEAAFSRTKTRPSTTTSRWSLSCQDRIPSFLKEMTNSHHITHPIKLISGHKDLQLGLLKL